MFANYFLITFWPTFSATLALTLKECFMKQWALTKDQDWEEASFMDGALNLDLLWWFSVPEEDYYYKWYAKLFIKEYL